MHAEALREPTECLGYAITGVCMKPILQSENTSSTHANGFNSFGRLFSHERREELAQVLFEKVVCGLYTPHRLQNTDIQRVVNELIEEAAQGPFKRLHIERNDDGSFRTFCAGCDVPLCCIVFETIRLTDEDAWVLSKHLEKATDVFLKEYCEPYDDDTQLGFIYKLKRAAPCAFLHENRCSVYTDRPERCKHFPLSRDNTGHNFKIYSWCNYLFNLLWHEATLRALELIFQKAHLSQARIRCGGVISSTGNAIYSLRR